MDRFDDEDAIDLREYIAVIRARKVTILLVTILVVAAALGLSYSQEPQYTAQTRVLVQSTAPIGSTSILPPQVNLETQREIAMSEPVAALVVEQLGLDATVESILDGLSVEGVAETEVMRFSYTSRSRELARDAVTAFAEGYLEFRRRQEIEGIEAGEEAVRRRIVAASNQLAEIERDLEAASTEEDDPLVATLESQRNILVARLGVLQQRLDDIQAQRSAQISSGQIIEEASLPTVPSSPNHRTNAILGGLFGLALGIGLAFLRERLDNRFRGRTDVENAVGAPVLATVGRFKQGRKSRTPSLATLGDGAVGTVAEAYRSLRTNVHFITRQKGIKSILVTSPSSGEGKSTTAANLAVVMAQAGTRVILVSADMRRPTIEDYFGIPRPGAHGLSTWLLAEGGPLSEIEDPGIPNLRIVPCGPSPPNPAELLTSPRLGRLIEFLEANADFVIFDSPPVLAVADATILATNVGGILLVIDAATTHRSTTIHAAEELHRVAGDILGTVLNNFDQSGTPYYYGPYSYYGTGEEPARRSPNGEARAPADVDERRLRRIFNRG